MIRGSIYTLIIILYSLILVVGSTSCTSSPSPNSPTATGERNALIRQERKQDTIPDYDPELKWVRKQDIRQLWQRLPSKYLTTESGIVPSPTFRQAVATMATQHEGYRDIIVDTVARYIFYDRQSPDAKKGEITVLTTYPFTNGQEMLFIKHDTWSAEKVATTQLHFLKLQGNNDWLEINQNEILPTINLQDYFKSDISNFLKEADHNAVPILCFEPQKGSKHLRVFLGEWKYKTEKFDYQPDIDYIDLVWKENRFQKIGLAQNLN